MTVRHSAIISIADAPLLGRAEDTDHLGCGRALTKMGERTAADGGQRPSNKKSVAQLWALAAHDLRQPMQAALLVARMLEAESVRIAQKRAARHVATALESLSEIIEVLALLSRIEAGLQIVPIRICHLSDVLAPTLLQVTEIATDRGIQLRHGSMRGAVRSNPELLSMATRSLLLNAIKFGSGDKILVSCRRRGSQLRLEVQFRGALLDGPNERRAFIHLPPSADRRVASELGLGICLLSHLCHRIGHSLHYTKLPREKQVLAMVLPLASTAR
jgi:signal transduction histidine kinase